MVNAQYSKSPISATNGLNFGHCSRTLTRLVDVWHVVLDVNLKGSFLCAKAMATIMLRQKIPGRIINIASDRGKLRSANLAAYCASKFGFIGFTQALAMELAPSGITVNAVCPGGLDTERLDYLGRREDGSYDAGLRAERVRQLAAKVPIGRFTTRSSWQSGCAMTRIEDPVSECGHAKSGGTETGLACPPALPPSLSSDKPTSHHLTKLTLESAS